MNRWDIWMQQFHWAVEPLDIDWFNLRPEKPNKHRSDEPLSNSDKPCIA